MAEETGNIDIQNRFRKVADRADTGLLSTLRGIWVRGMCLRDGGLSDGVFIYFYPFRS